VRCKLLLNFIYSLLLNLKIVMQEYLGLGKVKRRELEDQVKRTDSPSIPKEDRITDTTAKASQEQSNLQSKTSALLSLSALPSSFTTYLLSLMDSPAYANLTTSYLKDVFNPSTPDDPNVKYFSVAGRMEGLPIWHPLWLPKLVMDGAEDRARSAMKDAWEQSRSSSHHPFNEKRPLWAQDGEWGNDGLVEIQSAKWGEFLGVMEGCDRKPLFFSPAPYHCPAPNHFLLVDWEMRGARGIEFGVDLPAIPSIGLGSSVHKLNKISEEVYTNPDAAIRASGSETSDSDGWTLFSSRKKEEEKVHRELGADPSASSGVTPSLERTIKRERDDDVVRASTDRLSAVMDWIVEQVPSSPLLGKSKAETKEKLVQANSKRSDPKQELKTKEDLERFYIALTRKMYDEGL
jgi:triacylglycerol lipase